MEYWSNFRCRHSTRRASVYNALVRGKPLTATPGLEKLQALFDGMVQSNILKRVVGVMYGRTDILIANATLNYLAWPQSSDQIVHDILSFRQVKCGRPGWGSPLPPILRRSWAKRNSVFQKNASLLCRAVSLQESASAMMKPTLTIRQLLLGESSVRLQRNLHLHLSDNYAIQHQFPMPLILTQTRL